MMKIRLIAVSQNKFEYITAGEKDYLKRLTQYAEIEQVIVKEEPIKNGSDEIIELEGEKIIKQLKNDYITIALHVMGKEYSSHAFADLIEEIRDFRGGKIQIIIGGPLGLSQKVLAKADFTISFSKMTFTHQLIRLLLLEQLYRGFEILKGTEYHK